MIVCEKNPDRLHDTAIIASGSAKLITLSGTEPRSGLERQKSFFWKRCQLLRNGAFQHGEQLPRIVRFA